MQLIAVKQECFINQLTGCKPTCIFTGWYIKTKSSIGRLEFSKMENLIFFLFLCLLPSAVFSQLHLDPDQSKFKLIREADHSPSQ